MTNHELTIGRWYRFNDGVEFMIDTVLYKSGACWLMIHQKRGGFKSQFLSRPRSKRITTQGTTIYIGTDNLFTFLERGYILGTRYDGRYHKEREYQPK